MITCNNCGYEGTYTGTLCQRCGKKITLTNEQLKKQLSLLEDAIKNKRYEEQLECYRVLADNGYTQAEKEYAKILEKGHITARNLDLAMTYFYRAALKNDAYCAYRYSRLAARTNAEAARFWLIYAAILGCTEAYPVVAEEFSARGYEEDAHYFLWLAAACDDVDSIVTMAKRYYNGTGVSESQEHAKWYMDKLKIPPIYAIKLAYKLRGVSAKEPPAPIPKNYNGLLHRLSAQAKSCGYDTAYLKLLEILSERGDVEALSFVGLALIEGNSVEQNISEGLKMLTRAAAQGSVQAHIILGNFYSEGLYTEKNVALAIENYQKAGELGSAESYELIGDTYYSGKDVERDAVKAVSFYELAARLGAPSAQTKSDAIKRERDSLYGKALEELPHNTESAFRLFALSCDMGHTAAMLKLAECFDRGIGTKKNRHGAFSLYKKSAELGNTEAFMPLGLCYARGFGTRLDYEKARVWLTKAERLGFEGAREAIVKIMERKMKRIASRLYSTAMRLIHQKKPKSAKNYLDIAADLTHPKAIYTLGCLYEFGIGTDCDKDTAYSLYEKAYSLLFRDPRAQYKLTVLKMLKTTV